MVSYWLRRRLLSCVLASNNFHLTQRSKKSKVLRLTAYAKKLEGCANRVCKLRSNLSAGIAPIRVPSKVRRTHALHAAAMATLFTHLLEPSKHT
jgi:hypothetical protein